MGLAAVAANAQVEPAAEAGGATMLEEVVVTATRRTQSLGEVPLAVSVLSRAEIRNSGMHDVRALNQLSPSVLISSTGSESNTAARVRGVGTVGDNPGLESSVAIFIDGVYRSRTGVSMGELGDIQQIEVLRGPQGTLFGRNASAGLIHIQTAPPTFDNEANISASLGDYNRLRLEGSVNGALTDSLAGKLEGVYFERDGFYEDVNSGEDLNTRDRYFLRGQLLFDPADTLSLRLIGDYTRQQEHCCGAVFATDEVSDGTDPLNPFTPSQLLDPEFNPRIGLLQAISGLPLDQLYPSLDDPYARRMAVSPGRDFGGEVEQWGLSAELNWDIGGTTLTSITAYREYDGAQTADAEYNYVDILGITDGNNGRQFDTFSQELRLQGLAFNDRLDWLVGAYYSDEGLRSASTLKFGRDYGSYAACLVSSSVDPAVADPAGDGCLTDTGRSVVENFLSPGTLEAFDLLYGLRNLGDEGTVYNQDSTSAALFSHNIFSVTETVDFTLGLRYTHESKDFDADFNNTNTVCPAMRELSPDILPALAPAFITLACQGNSSSELNALSLADELSNEELTGTAALSWKPGLDWLLYGSYSRGYKAGGFNLDRSALGNPAERRGNGDVANLAFDPEIVDAYELGLKYQGARLSASLTLFHQEFENFQLNTFDGTVYIVETINSCGSGLGGQDQDDDPLSGACSAGDVEHGLESRGVELDGLFQATPDLAIAAGVTYTDTRYEGDLVGDASGSPLNPSLRRLPGERLSNAPKLVSTASVNWTPKIGGSGLTGLVYLSVRNSDAFNTGSNLAGQKVQDRYTVLNGRLGVSGRDGGWSAELWGRNLLDEDYAQVIFDTAFVGSMTSYLGDPRTWGVTLRKRF